MITVFTEGDAAVVASVVAAVASIVGGVIAYRGKRRVEQSSVANTADHGEVITVLSALRVDIHELKSDVREVKADVRELKQADRDASDRIHRLEHPGGEP